MNGLNQKAFPNVVKALVGLRTVVERCNLLPKTAPAMIAAASALEAATGSKPRQVPFESIRDGLIARGYLEQTPPPQVWTDDQGQRHESDPNVTDRALAEENQCEVCGKAAFGFHPFYKARPKSTYRAFAVCPGCGFYQEF